MNINWKELTAEEYCGKVADGTHDTPKPKEVGEYLITSKHITSGKVDLSSAYRISKEDFEKINIRSKVDKWDVLLTMIGTVGEIVLVDHEPNYAIKNIGLFKCGDETKARWLKYYLLSPDGKAEIQSRLSGTTQEYIALGELRKLPIIFPPLPEQRAIADVLSSLDDKIDLLHQQNKTLEGMAEALYRRFFVDNRQAIWQECTIGDLADHEKTSIHPNRKPDMLFYHYSIPTFDETHMPVHELGVSIQSNKYKVTTNTVLFSKLNPHKDKRIWLITGSIPDNSVSSTEFQVLKPKAEKHLFFLYGFVNHPENYDEIAAGVGGTSSSHQRIDPEVIFKTRCFLPDDTTLNTYNEMIGPIFDKMCLNLNSMYTLSRLRDTLLPKLISGEVRVKS